MSSLVEYVDTDGQTRRGYAVVIVSDQTAISQAAGSKTEFTDQDGRRIHATPLVIVEDYRPGGGGGGGGGSDVYDGGTF